MNTAALSSSSVPAEDSDDGSNTDGVISYIPKVLRHLGGCIL